MRQLCDSYATAVVSKVLVFVLVQPILSFSASDWRSSAWEAKCDTMAACICPSLSIQASIIYPHNLSISGWHHDMWKRKGMQKITWSRQFSGCGADFDQLLHPQKNVKTSWSLKKCSDFPSSIPRQSCSHTIWIWLVWSDSKNYSSNYSPFPLMALTRWLCMALPLSSSWCS